MLLAGDIGGTNARLALCETGAGHVFPVIQQTFPSRTAESLDEIVRLFLQSHKISVSQACFGVPGPVRCGRCETTNLPWVVDAQRLTDHLHIDTVLLINDLEATAYGIAALEEKDFTMLNKGAAHAEGNAAVIAAGTGLGEAGLYWDGQRHWPFACEGGHTDFAPRTEVEMELLRYLLARFSRVSYERVLSGPGLYHIYQFLRDTGRGEEPPWLAETLRQKDPAAVISQTALDRRSPLCEQALDLFVSVYGAEAGNLALKIMATSGIFLGGGIAPKILPRLQGPAFLDAFVAKGRMKSVLEATPVMVMPSEKTALLGAARYAALRGLT